MQISQVLRRASAAEDAAAETAQMEFPDRQWGCPEHAMSLPCSAPEDGETTTAATLTLHSIY
jgi:hypothetical protein